MLNPIVLCLSRTPKCLTSELMKCYRCSQHILLDATLPAETAWYCVDVSALEFRELSKDQNVPIIHERYETDQKCCRSPQHSRTGQLRNLPLVMHRNRSKVGESSNQFRNVAQLFERHLQGCPLTTVKNHTSWLSTKNQMH